MPRIIGTGLETYLHRQAREQALNIVAEAKEKANEIIRQAQREIEEARQEIEGKAKQEIEEKRRRALAQARLQAKQTLIRHQQEVMERLWQAAEERLRSFDDPEKRFASLKQLLIDAAIQLEGGPLSIQTNEKDYSLVREKLSILKQTLDAQHLEVQHLELSDTPVLIWGGMIVRRFDRNQLVDNSFNERFSLAKRTLRDRVYHLLVPDDQESKTP